MRAMIVHGAAPTHLGVAYVYAPDRKAKQTLEDAFEVSERRACSVLGVDRTSVRYRSCRASDAAVRVRLRELAAIRRRCGYRHLHVFLGQEGSS